MLKLNTTKNRNQHSFHLVDPSPWPILSGFSALMLTVGGVLCFNRYIEGPFLVTFGLGLVIYMMYCWWTDVIREAMFEGQHTSRVERGLRIGVALFIVSEVMFFVAFFWAFFHSSLNGSAAIGAIWPPAQLATLDPWKIPFLNTLILLTSGATVTIAHHSIITGEKEDASVALERTIVLALIFTAFQVYEYLNAPFSINTSVYGSAFFMATGFHGFHVIIGTCFLTVCLLRLYLNHFTQERHLGFEAAAWYWHFVDVVWLFLFASIYWWGS